MSILRKKAAKYLRNENLRKIKGSEYHFPVARDTRGLPASVTAKDSDTPVFKKIMAKDVLKGVPIDTSKVLKTGASAGMKAIKDGIKIIQKKYPKFSSYEILKRIPLTTLKAIAKKSSLVKGFDVKV